MRARGSRVGNAAQSAYNAALRREEQRLELAAAADRPVVARSTRARSDRRTSTSATLVGEAHADDDSSAVPSSTPPDRPPEAASTNRPTRRTIHSSTTIDVSEARDEWEIVDGLIKDEKGRLYASLPLAERYGTTATFLAMLSRQTELQENVHNRDSYGILKPAPRRASLVGGGRGPFGDAHARQPGVQKRDAGRRPPEPR